MEAYEGEEPSIEDIKRCIRKGTRDLRSSQLTVFCIQEQGVQIILTAVSSTFSNRS